MNKMMDRELNKNKNVGQGIKTVSNLLPCVLLLSLIVPNCFANNNDEDSYEELTELLENISVEPGYDEQQDQREYKTVCKKVSEVGSKIKRKVCRNVPVKDDKPK